MKFGIELVPYVPTEKITELVKKAENAGFQYCWITDHYTNRNVYSALATIAKGTRSIQIGTGVTNPFTVHPTHTASAIASIDELSNGRAVLGLGPGDRTTLSTIGVELFKPLKAVSETVEITRKLWTGGSVTYDGEIFKLRSARLNFKPKHKILIYLGAQGPGMLRLAGKIADGVLINASHPSDFEVAIPFIKEGAEKAGRRIEQIEIAAYTSFSIADAGDKAKNATKPVVAFIVAGAPPAVMERHGISIVEATKVKDAIAAGKIGEAIRSVTDAMSDAFCIYGTPSDCLKKVKELSKIGVTQLVVGSPIGPDPSASIEMIEREIMPSFR